MPTSNAQSSVTVVNDRQVHNGKASFECGADRSRAEMLADGIGRLVEGQRQFAEEFGLPHERVFHADFEQFKGRLAADVVREWLQADSGEMSDLHGLLRDLVDHQLALVSAVELVAAEAEPVQPPRFARFLPDSLLRRWWPPVESSLLSRVVVAYAHSRESAAGVRNSEGAS